MRRNRRRFWRSRGEDDRDKLAAYQTLYEVLTTLCKLLAPFIPFLTERMYQKLVREPLVKLGRADAAPESVHHCDYPEPDESLIDQSLSNRMNLVLKIVSSARALRERAGQRVRQPLPELRVTTTSELAKEAIGQLGDHICDELNVKQITPTESIEELVRVEARPNFAQLGPKYGSAVKAIAAALSSAPYELLRRLQAGQSVTVTADGRNYELEPGDVQIELQRQEGWLVDAAGEVQIALCTRLTPELVREGLARDAVRHIQQLRKEEQLNIEDRIKVRWYTADTELAEAIEEWKDYICRETLCLEMTAAAANWPEARTVKLAGKELHLDLRKAQQR